MELQYERNDINFTRNKFRVRGDVVEIFPSYSGDTAVRVEFFGDEIDRISEINTVTGEVKNVVSHKAIYPASHYIVPREKMQQALVEIREEMEERVAYFKANDKLIEAQRIMERTNYDMEMLTEIGFCKGIENYSRVLSGRAPGSCPYTLLDYFPKDFLLFVDESHVTLPQVRGMYGGDHARKQSLVDYGFRLPSAFDNRPLTFDEFYSKLNQVILSARRRDRLSGRRAGELSSRSSARPAWSTRRSTCARWRGRSTTCSPRSMPAPRKTSGCW